MKPTCKIFSDGSKSWYLDGKLHHEDGPAVEQADGYKAWYFKGKRHREDGPAVESADDYKAWYLDGKQYTEQDYWKELYRRGIITKEEMILKLI